MKLGEKIRYLREVEGSLRGLGRPMTQLELVRAMREELGKGRSEKGRADKSGSNKQKTISQSYLSQIENGARATHDAVFARAAGKVFQGASRLSGG